ncbi:MAG: Allophanate hydrolase (EC [uncultured Paraburkholderia sp.]|nr:MAG: Allophanate hydrolase (EC [uncultured Paraburkholderia sp.]
MVATGQVDFALGTDTAGSGRIPAGLNNIVGLKPSRGLLSTRGIVAAAQSVDCVSIFASTVGLAARVLAVAAGYDPQDPYSRSLKLRTQPLPHSFRFGIPDQLEFFGDTQSRTAFDASITRLQELGGVAVTIAYRPLDEVAQLLYESALVAERYAAIRGFFDERSDDVIEPVRSIIGAGRGYSAADYCDAQIRLRELDHLARPIWEQIDVLVVPTAPTHYTIEQMQADPVALNRNLGKYTNFVNLLDYAAIAVPSGLREDGLPFGITLIGPCASDLQLADLGQRYHQATGLTQGTTGRALPLPEAVVRLERGDVIEVAVVGAHLSGMPLNSQLTDRGAQLVRQTCTAREYRLFALSGTVPPKPGLLRVEPGNGHAIAVEIWSMPLTQYGSFVAAIGAPLGIGTLLLDDGSKVQGFVCEALATHGAQDISNHGGWRAFLAAQATDGEAGASGPPR